MLVLLAASAACGGGDRAVAPVDASLVGTYVLASVNDRPLPAETSRSAFGTTVAVAGTLVLRADRTFVRTETDRGFRADGSVVGPDVVTTTAGRFAERGAALSFEVDLGRPIGFQELGTATRVATRLAYKEFLSDAVVFTYEKR